LLGEWWRELYKFKKKTNHLLVLIVEQEYVFVESYIEMCSCVANYFYCILKYYIINFKNTSVYDYSYVSTLISEAKPNLLILIKYV